jgi:protein-S-isoprenylcysteine O-methyltransferase Ste14
VNDASRDIPGVLAPPPLIYLAGLALGLVAGRLWPLRFVPDSLRRLRWSLGGSLALGGLGLAGWAVRTMYRAGTHPEPNKPVTALVTEGPFRLSRNPIYLGFTVAYLGLALLLDALWSLLLLPAVLAVMVRGVIAREEAYLERRFGERYRAYRARVRRWI